MHSLNPAKLKLELMAYGIARGSGLPDTLTNPFGLVHLVLPDELAVSTHISQSPYTLHSKEGHYFLETKNGTTSNAVDIPVLWTEPLHCYQKKTSSGILVGDILTVHGKFIAVHPKGPCRFGLSGLACRYCGSSKELSSHPPFTKKDLIEAIKIVLAEKRCDIVNLSSGRVETDDGGIEWLSPWVTEIRKHLNILISLDLSLPKTTDWIDRAYAIGVDALYYDTNFENEAEYTRQLETVKYASKIFPPGAVLSHLILGFESLEDTKKNMLRLIAAGTIPILIYFPPQENSNLNEHWTLTPDQSMSLYGFLYEQLLKANLTAHWVQQHDVVLTPLEGRYFSSSGNSGKLLTLRNFFETGFGRSIRFGLARLRRHLRVVPE